MRLSSLLIAAAFSSCSTDVAVEDAFAAPGVAASPTDLRALLDAAHGASPIVCSLAADGVERRGWYGGSVRAPHSTLPHIRVEAERSAALPAADVQLLLENVTSSDACVRELSVRVLGSAGGEAGARGLMAHLASADSAVRAAAANGLGLIEPKDMATTVLVKALRDAAATVRANAAWALGRIQDGTSLRGLLGAVADADSTVRESVIGAVGQLDSASAVPALLRVLRDDRTASVRRAAAWALGNLEAESAVRDLADVLGRDGDASVREMCAWALGNIEHDGASRELQQAVQRDASPRVRETAAWALGNIEDGSAAVVLGEAAARDADRRVRATAAWAIGNSEVRRAPEGLITALADSDDDVRTKAAWALSEVSDAAALPALRAAFKRETDPEVRKAVLRALLKSGERSEGALTALLESSDPEVREAAVRGLAGRGRVDPWPWPEPRPRPFP
ncbi:MAG: HEAT repeat domain-containing protein [Gemmatimonadaceae bacterium]|nr:HEAT repeat domain-containing protein [Gemmatimonadaceae bacterium]